jgi:DNA polymerase-1
MEVQRKHPAAKCEECPLYEVGKFIPSRPAKTGESRYAFIGEAGGLQEARKGEPFVGPSGQLLDRVLAHYGASREEVFLGNAVACRPPDNATPAQTAILACRPRLFQELEEANVTEVAALGNTATQSLLGSREGVTKLRVGPGRYNKEGHRIVPTFHPAACLRRAEMFPDMVTDIGKLFSQPPRWETPDYRVFEDPREAIAALHSLRDDPREYVAIDIEVDIDKDKSFDHPQNYHLLCVGLAYARNKAIVIGETACGSEDVMDALSELAKSKKLIAQNGKFDLAGLLPHIGKQKLFFDTMLASYCLDERQGVHGLKHMAVEFLGAPRYDEEIKRYVGPNDGYGVIPRDVLYRYNAFDVCCTFALFQMFVTRLDAQQLRPVHDMLLRASQELIFVEYNGIGVDLRYIDELTEQFTARLQALEQTLDEVTARTTGGKVESLNPRSPKQVKEALAAMNITVDSTNAETLEGLRERLEGDPRKDFIDALLHYRFEHKQFSTYVKGVRKRARAGRVHPTFLLHGTTTGRLSCRNPNLQNVPRDKRMRRMYVPTKESNIFVQADYGQAELRVLAWLAGDQYFTQIFNDGQVDVFDDLTPILYPGARKELMSPEDWKELRIRVKAFVYGLNYGRTEYSIAREYGLPVNEAKAMRERFFDVIPEIVEFRKDVLRRIHRGEDLISPFGRHRRFYLITKENREELEKEALAFLPQSTASDICLNAMVAIRPQLVGTGCFVRNIVHDSILLEGPAERQQWMADILTEEMIGSAANIVGDYIQFKVDVEVGKSWGDLSAA